MLKDKIKIIYIYKKSLFQLTMICEEGLVNYPRFFLIFVNYYYYIKYYEYITFTNKVY
jgi:hypothetical protein